MEELAAAAGDDSVEAEILKVFLTRWPEMQSDIVSATYLLDPLFVENSKRAAGCTIILWNLARRVIVCIHNMSNTHTHLTYLGSSR